MAFYFASSIFEEKAAQIWASRKALSTEQKLWKISARREGEAEQVQHTYTPPARQAPEREMISCLNRYLPGEERQEDESYVEYQMNHTDISRLNTFTLP